MKKFVVLCLALAACAAPEPKLAPGDPLSGTRWSLISIGGSPVLSSQTASMQFDKGRLSGSDGCNRYATGYAATEKDLKVGPNVASTRMACPGPIMDEATTFLAILSRAAGYQRNGNRLTLLERDGRPLADFQRIEP